MLYKFRTLSIEIASYFIATSRYQHNVTVQTNNISVQDTHQAQPQIFQQDSGSWRRKLCLRRRR